MEITASSKPILFTPVNRPHRILIPALALAYLLLFAVLTSTLWQTQDTFVYLMSALPALPALWANHRLARGFTGTLRLRSTFIQISIFLWFIGMTQTAILSLNLPITAHWQLPNAYAYAVVALVLRLLAVTIPPAEQRSRGISILDTTLALLICILGLVNLYLPTVDHLPTYMPQVIKTSHFFDYLTGVKIFLALAALIAIPAVTTQLKAHYIRLLCIYYCVDAAVFFLTNDLYFVYLNLPHNSAFHAIIALPLLLFTVLALLTRPKTVSISASNTSYIVRGATPFFLTLAAFILSIRLFWTLPLLASLAVTTAIVLAGLRIAITQSQVMQERDRFSELTLHDPLTHAGNRLGFDRCLENEWARSARNDDPLSLLLIDIDNFKSVNDTHGHLHGDACLRAAAQALQQALPRQIDQLFRYGGEEFAVILPLTRANDAWPVAEKLRHTIESLSIEGNSITISLGLATHEPLDCIISPEQLIRLADNALYRAKQTGKNRVEYLPADSLFHS